MVFMKKRTAFTLVEMMVIVAVLGILSTFGFASYSRFAQRLEVENAAKELITFIRQVQGYARNGDRGNNALGSGCNATVFDIASDNSKLLGWRIDLKANEANGYPVCWTSSSPRVADETGGKSLDLTTINSSIKFYCSGWSTCSSSTNYFFVKSIFGDTWYQHEYTKGSIDTTGVGNKNKIIVVSDGEFYYRFRLSNGSITNGSFCEKAHCFDNDRTNSLTADD